MITARFTLTFPQEVANNPVTLKLIRNFALNINILKAQISPGQTGHLLLEITGEQAEIDRALEYVKSENVECTPLNKQVAHDESRCVSCGACTAVCFSGALTLNKVDWKLLVATEKCIACGLCVEACPLQAVKISFGQ